MAQVVIGLQIQGGVLIPQYAELSISGGSLHLTPTIGSSLDDQQTLATSSSVLPVFTVIAYAMAVNDSMVISTALSPINITLPQAPVVGKVYYVTDSTGTTVDVVTGSGASIIHGNSGALSSYAVTGQTAPFMFDGTNWWVVF